MEPAYLLDTHVLLWSLYDSRKLRAAHAEILGSQATTFVSAATVWEIEIKKKGGGLPVPDRIWDQSAEAGHLFLPIDVDHARAAGSLPLHHRDPFDRMLIAQALAEGLTVATTDSSFGAYGVATVWD